VVVLWIPILVVYFLTVSLADKPLLDHQPTSLVPVGTVMTLFRSSVVLTVFLLVVSGFFAGHGSPSFAGPVASLSLWSGVVAVVPCSEVLAPSGDVLLDLHVGITEADDLGLLPVLDADSRLLGSTGSPEGLVQALAFTGAWHLNSLHISMISGETDSRIILMPRARSLAELM